jgi:hypothetical protein
MVGNVQRPPKTPAASAAATGGHVELAQVEVTLGIAGDLLTKEALEPGTVKRR